MAKEGADLVVSGLAANAIATARFSGFPFGDLDVAQCLKALYDTVDQVKDGDLAKSEALLTAQAVTLNAIFADLANRAAKAEYLDTLERYLRLAMKAQGQCRATIATLAEVQRPPTIFAQQANVAHGPQQVNNTVNAAAGREAGPRAENQQDRAKRTIGGRR